MFQRQRSCNINPTNSVEKQSLVESTVDIRRHAYTAYFSMVEENRPVLVWEKY